MTFSRSIASITLLLSTIPFVFGQSSAQDDVASRAARAERARRAQEEFYRMRAWPRSVLPSGARSAALAAMERMRSRERNASPRASGGAVWTLIGPRPTLVLAEQVNGGSPYSSGRVAALAVDPRNPN